MQNTIPKFRQSSIVFEKPGILARNLKTLTKSEFWIWKSNSEFENCPTVQYFLLNFPDKNPGISEIIEVCLNLGTGFCITWKKLVREKHV